MSTDPNFEDERLDALLARASTIATAKAAPPVEHEAVRRGRKGLVAGIVIVGALAVGAGYVVAKSGDDNSTAGATTVAPLGADVQSTEAPATTLAVSATTDSGGAATPAVTHAPATTSAAAPAEPEPSTTDTGPATTVAGPVTTVATTANTTVPSTSPNAPATTDATAPAMLRGEPSEHLPGGQVWPYGLYQDDIMYLRGVVPDAAIGNDIQHRAEEILGADNVRNELTVDPSVPQVETVVVRLGNSVLFKRGDFDIPPESEPGFVLWAAFMQSNPNVTLTVIGHADAQGTPEDNMALALRRAQVAADRITRNGIDPARVNAVSHGEDDPIATNDTDAGRSLNRRVEFAVTGLFT